MCEIIQCVICFCCEYKLDSFPCSCDLKCMAFMHSQIITFPRVLWLYLSVSFSSWRASTCIIRDSSAMCLACSASSSELISSVFFCRRSFSASSISSSSSTLFCKESRSYRKKKWVNDIILYNPAEIQNSSKVNSFAAPTLKIFCNMKRKISYL